FHDLSSLKPADEWPKAAAAYPRKSPGRGKHPGPLNSAFDGLLFLFFRLVDVVAGAAGFVALVLLLVGLVPLALLGLGGVLLGGVLDRFAPVLVVFLVAGFLALVFAGQHFAVVAPGLGGQCCQLVGGLDGLVSHLVAGVYFQAIPGLLHVLHQVMELLGGQ